MNAFDAANINATILLIRAIEEGIGVAIQGGVAIEKVVEEIRAAHASGAKLTDEQLHAHATAAADAIKRI